MLARKAIMVKWVGEDPPPPPPLHVEDTEVLNLEIMKLCLDGRSNVSLQKCFIEQQKSTCCWLEVREEKGRREKRTHSRYTVGTVNICVRAETIPPTRSSMSELCNMSKLVITTQSTIPVRRFNH